MAGRVKKCPNFIKNGQKLPSQAAFALTLYDLFRLLHDPHGLLAAKKAFKDCYNLYKYDWSMRWLSVSQGARVIAP